MFKQLFKRLLLAGCLVLCFANVNTVSAQTPAVLDGTPGGETGGDGNGGFGDGPVVPLSSNLSVLLLASGIAYGLKKVKE